MHRGILHKSSSSSVRGLCYTNTFLYFSLFVSSAFEKRVHSRKEAWWTISIQLQSNASLKRARDEWLAAEGTLRYAAFSKCLCLVQTLSISNWWLRSVSGIFPDQLFCMLIETHFRMAWLLDVDRRIGMQSSAGLQIRGSKFQSSNSNSRELELTNWLGLVLGCIEANFCK